MKSINSYLKHTAIKIKFNLNTIMTRHSGAVSYRNHSLCQCPVSIPFRKFENASRLQPEQLLNFCTLLFGMELYATLTTRMQICTLMHSTLYKYVPLLIHVQYDLSHSLIITRQACWLLYELVDISPLHQAVP